MSPKIAMTAMAGSTIVSAYGSYQQGKTAKAASDYNAAINDRNSLIKDQEAAQIVMSEELAIEKFKREYAGFSDAQQQGFRYNGWLAESDTPLLVALASAQEADEEIAARRYNAKIGAGQAREEGLQQRMAGELNRMYGRSASDAGKTRALGTLLSGASDISYIQATA